MAELSEEDDEELQRAFRMSLASPSPEDETVQTRSGLQKDSSLRVELPEAKRSRGLDGTYDSEYKTSEECRMTSAEDSERWLQREIRAAAAERRLSFLNAIEKEQSADSSTISLVKKRADQLSIGDKFKTNQIPSWQTISSVLPVQKQLHVERACSVVPEQLPPLEMLPLDVAHSLYTMVFGDGVSSQVLAQWSRQGFRFSTEEETSLGLVQREGGPCGLLAPIQALVIKHLIFMPADKLDTCLEEPLRSWNSRIVSGGFSEGPAGEAGTRTGHPSLGFSDAARNRALVRAMAETLWLAGGKEQAVVATLESLNLSQEVLLAREDEAVAEVLTGVSMQTPEKLQEAVGVRTCTSMGSLVRTLQVALPAFRSDLGALLLLFSALLSRTLEGVESDRDDPEQPLVTRPFGHASQEIVNLLLCGHAVANVFDGSMDLGGGMCLKGIPQGVQVGFLTLLEALNLCKVGQHLKHPAWPVWVVGSESHYTVLFALSPAVQDDCAPEAAESREDAIRRAFDTLDTSGGGGFITPQALRKLQAEQHFELHPDTLAALTATDVVVWSDLWQVLQKLEFSQGGFLSSPPQPPPSKKQFEVFHFNGIAKSDVGAGMAPPFSAAPGAPHAAAAAATSRPAEANSQRPRLTRLRVTVPPRWTPESMMITEYQTAPATVEIVPDGVTESNMDSRSSVRSSEQEPPAQNAPLVDCIRTRWQRATCNWVGDAPSIV